MRASWLLLLAAYVSGVAAASADVPPMPISLGGPEVFKLDRNTRAMTAGDLDGNGYPDIAVINNDKAKIEILYQYGPDEPRDVRPRAATDRRWRPVLDDSRFRRDGLVTGTHMYALAAGDLNGDGRPDLAFTGKPDGLVVFYRGQKDTWENGWSYALETPSQWRTSLAISDLNGDGRADLLMLGKEALLVFLQTKSGGLDSPRRYPLADGDSYGAAITDMNGDGLDDVVYLAPKSRYALRLRLRRESGSLGPEQTFRFRTPRSGLAFRGSEGAPAELAAVHTQSGLIETITMAPVDLQTKADPIPPPQVYALPSEASSDNSYALGDLDGDSRVDVVVADHKGARVWVYRQLQDDTFAEPMSYPSFSDIRSVSAGDTDGNGRAELYVASQAEESVGVATMLASGRLGYPEPLPVTGKPLAISLVEMRKGAGWELVCLLRRDKKRHLVVLARDQLSGAWKVTQELLLKGMRTDPTGMKPVDFNQDGRTDLVITVLRNPAWLLRREPDQRFSVIDTGQSVRRGLLDNLRPGDLSIVDVDRDGKDEMIVVGKGYARALRMDQSGKFTVVDQFNAIDREAEIGSAFPLDADGDGRQEFLLLSRKSDELQLLRQDDDAVYRTWLSLPMGTIDIVDTRLLPTSHEGAHRVLYLGKHRFWLVAVGRGGLDVRTSTTHEASVEEMRYSDVAFGDLNGDREPELVALDNKETRILEILRRDGDHWRSAMHFAVFEEHPREEHRNTAKEPRELLVTDMTGDGRDDILLLVHDRVLLYPSR